LRINVFLISVRMLHVLSTHIIVVALPGMKTDFKGLVYLPGNKAYMAYNPVRQLH